MSQIKLVPSDKETKKILMGNMKRFNIFMVEAIAAVNNGFNIPDGYRNDISVTVNPPADYIYNEANVQIEVGYTAGEDEYKQGKPFDPTMPEQEKVTNLINEAFTKFLNGNNSMVKLKKLPHLSLSVWCQPYRKSAFKQWY